MMALFHAVELWKTRSMGVHGPFETNDHREETEDQNLHGVLCEALHCT
jgi:hypothetical protein